ncbi:MAG: hypothetical protein WA188_10080 [Terriglobales bacterium]
MDMERVVLLVALSLLSVFGPALSSASDGGSQPSGTGAQAEFSADDFDWREMVPYLFIAAGLPEEQGIKAVLENSKVLRAYVANEVLAECRPDKNPCAAKGDSFMLEGEVSKRIDEIVQEGIFRRHKMAIVDYRLARRPFPFSEIVAVKREKQRDAYLILELADRSYTAAQLQSKYGAPQDTDIFQWYSVYKYRLETARYTSKAVFEIDPVDGAVMKVAISLKPKNRH